MNKVEKLSPQALTNLVFQKTKESFEKMVQEKFGVEQFRQLSNAWQQSQPGSSSSRAPINEVDPTADYETFVPNFAYENTVATLSRDEDTMIKGLFESLENFRSMKELPTPPELTIQLLKHQRQGLFLDGEARGRAS